MKVCKVQFKKLGKKYFFSCEDKNVNINDKVVVNTIRGLELGTVVEGITDITKNEVISELKEVIRIASASDIEKYEQNKKDESTILEDVKKLVKKQNLEMKVLGADYTLDRSKLIIYFEAEERIDFRDLVKDIAEIYRTRIELRQVGSRDGAKSFGGIGPCGLIVCCQTFLTEFDNVSVKMAKNQNLSLNPIKISGNCGKLLCCINYENDLYTELRKEAPDLGDIVETPNGQAKVLSCDVLNQSVKVKYLNNDSFAIHKFNEIKFIRSIDKREKVIK